MNFGLARKFEIYDFDKNERHTIIARPSAWHAALLWQDSHKDTIPKDMETVYSVYIWFYFAVKVAGLLEQYDLPGALTNDVILEMLERYSVSSGDVTDEDLPQEKSFLA